MTSLQILDVMLALGLTLRLVRLVVTDDLGLWFIRGPLSIWAYHKDSKTNADPRFGTPVYQPRWRSKLASGLECPFCVGFWIGCFVLLSLWAVGGPGSAWEPWRWVAGAFTLNWIAAHIGSRLDVTEE